MFLRPVSVAALAAALLPYAAIAQTSEDQANVEFSDVTGVESTRDFTIIVTGERDGITRLPVSVTSLVADDLERQQALTVSDALATISGVTVTRNGPIGSFTGVRIRGADAAQTLVVIDGVRVGDPTSPGGGFDFGSLLAGNIARIDVLRGSNSVVWGSDAIGGVILIETGGRSQLSAEYGSNATARIDGNYELNAGPLSLNVGGGWFDSEGISAASSGIENDGFRQYRGNARLAADLGNGITASTSILYADSRLELDGFAPPTFAFGDTADVQRTSELYSTAKIQHDAGQFQSRFSFSLADINRDTFDGDGAPTFLARGRTERINWQGQWSATDNRIALVGGAEREWSRSLTSDGFLNDQARTAITGVYGTATLRPASGVRLGLGGRYDDHRDFGADTSLSANALVDLAPSFAVRGGYSEGFKAPTLFQLSPTTSGFGNPVLRPEESNAYDIGLIFRRGEIMGSGRFGGIRVEASLFRRDSRNLIDFVSCNGPVAPPICGTGSRPFGTYANVDRARASGAELDITLWPTSGLTVRAGYAYISTRDRSVGQATFGNRLARRPVHSGTVAADYAAGGYSVGGEVRLVGESFDNASNGTQLNGYALAALRGSLKLGNTLELFARIENLFDVRYETVAGYGTYGRTSSAGIRCRL